MNKLWEELKDFKSRVEMVELSHPVSAKTPHWAGFPPMEG